MNDEMAIPLPWSTGKNSALPVQADLLKKIFPVFVK
jgi:hypothetical protein